MPSDRSISQVRCVVPADAFVPVPGVDAGGCRWNVPISPCTRTLQIARPFSPASCPWPDVSAAARLRLGTYAGRSIRRSGPRCVRAGRPTTPASGAHRPWSHHRQTRHHLQLVVGRAKPSPPIPNSRCTGTAREAGNRFHAIDDDAFCLWSRPWRQDGPLLYDEVTESLSDGPSNGPPADANLQFTVSLDSEHWPSPPERRPTRHTVTRGSD